jgi:hypothetical protein
LSVGDDDFGKRVRRIYAALGHIEVADLSKFPPRLGEPGSRHIFQDFRGGLSDEELENLAQSAVANVANVKDHLRRWARRNDRDLVQIDDAVKRSDAIRIIIDLADREKHGGERNNGGYSRRSPQLGKIERSLEIRPPKGVPVEVLFGEDGPIFSPGANPHVVLTAPVLDRSGVKIGDLHRLLMEALSAWDSLLQEWGVLPTP